MDEKNVIIIWTSIETGKYANSVEQRILKIRKHGFESHLPYQI